ncbi:MAG: 3-phosphoshikimate 1-carboxyvinyltransferase [Bacteroidia bacterium]
MRLDFTQRNFDIEIDLPASKSIHNRVLIFDALYGLNLKITNPSNSADSVLLQSLLKSENEVLNCKNAGTVFRFLTAYYSVIDKPVILTGNQRMLNRPIGDLVNALQSLGADIEYSNSEGFPPIKIPGGLKKGGSVSINGNTSSQFISALAMIGPKLENGLEINIEGQISSKPYIEMTVKLMQNLGFDINFNQNQINAKSWAKNFRIKPIDVEPDWSAVAFWFQIIALGHGGKVFFKRLKTQSVQGDSVLANWSKMLGIKLTETTNGILIEPSNIPVLDNLVWDFTNYPDLAPSIIVLHSTFKKRATFKGLESLKIKESNRTLALQTELKKCNVNFKEVNNEWILDATNFELKENTLFENYDDHRIAMAFGCLSLIKPIKMKNKETVSKSYPDFWEHLSKFRK